MEKGHAERRRGIQVTSSTRLSWSYHLREEHMHVIVMSSVRLLRHPCLLKTSQKHQTEVRVCPEYLWGRILYWYQQMLGLYEAITRGSAVICVNVHGLNMGTCQ